MKQLAWIVKPGLALIALGILCLGLSGLRLKTREKVFQVGGLRAAVTTVRTVPSFRYAAVVCIGGGALVAAAGFPSAGFISREI